MITIQQQLKQALYQRDTLLSYLTGKNKPTSEVKQLSIVREIAALDRQVQLLESTPFKDRNNPANITIINTPSKLNTL